MKDEKIIQIIPAPNNLYVTFKDRGEKIESKVLCLGLTNQGDVVFIDSDDHGCTGIADNADNFYGAVWK